MTRRKHAGLLQGYKEGKTRAALYKACWTRFGPPHLFVCTNQQVQRDRAAARAPDIVRLVTFDGPPNLVEETPIHCTTVKAQLRDALLRITAHIAAVAPSMPLWRLDCYFYRDADDRLWLAFPGVMECGDIASPTLHLTLAPSMVQQLPATQLGEHASANCALCGTAR